MRSPRHWGGCWGRRWNRAVHDALHDLFFRPLARRTGLVLAVAAAFIMSGLLHELVFSIPARGGLGLCTLYFMIQLLGVWVDRHPIGCRLGLGRSWRGWLFCAAVVLGPVYLLFHRPLLDNVMYPWMMQVGLI
ncbi:MAG: MBOAT family protein [Phycisphaeraceae bacterium]